MAEPLSLAGGFLAYGAFRFARWAWRKMTGTDEAEYPKVQQQPVSDPPNRVVEAIQAIRQEVVDVCAPVIEKVSEIVDKGVDAVKEFAHEAAEVVEEFVEVLVEAPEKLRKAFAAVMTPALVVMDSVRCLDVEAPLTLLKGPVRIRAPTFA